MLNALSVDVEDWFQVGAFEKVIDRDRWEQLPQRVERNSERVLALFDRAGVKGTFFTLGWVAQRHPALIRRIVEAGHEIASHGWDHRRVFTMAPEAFRADLQRAQAAIADAGGQMPRGYRAPSFSIDRRTPWAHAILAEENYLYSSSVAPVRHDHYGWPEAPRFAHRPIPGGTLIELPISTARIAGRSLPAGGGFFRLFPWTVSQRAIQRLNRTEQRPAVFYFHPWEIDPDQPRVRAAPLKSRLRHYSRLKAMEPKLLRLLTAFEWGRTDEVVAREQARLA
jgi:polysaccharide deacetylase family protein (PEP-CTERM system associated)